MEKHPFTHIEQKYILPSDCVAGDNVGKVTLMLNTYPDFHFEYFRTEVTEADFACAITAGNADSAFAISSIGELTVLDPELFTATRTLTVRVTLGASFMDTSCVITYIPAADCVYFDPDFVGTSTGARAAPFLKFKGSGLGNGTAGKTYLYRRGKTYLNENFRVVNLVGADWIQVGAWGQGVRPIIDGSTNSTADRFMDIGIFNNSDPLDVSQPGHNVRVFDIETTHDNSTTWYPFQIQPFGSGIEMRRIKMTNLTFENGHMWFRAGSEWGYINKNGILQDIESLDFQLNCRGVKLEGGGILGENIRAESNFVGNTSVGVSFAHMPNNTLRYARAKSSSGQGFTIRAGNQKYEFCVVDGASNSLIANVHSANDGLGGEFLINETSGFENIIIKNSGSKAMSFQRTTGLTDVVNGLKFVNVIIKQGAVGAELLSYSKNIELINCQITDLSSTGVRIYSGATGAKIINGTIANVAGTDINTNESVAVSNTIFTNSSGVLVQSQNSNNVSDFKGATDYRLVPGSALIGAATRITLFDAQGNDRLNPTTIGAYEYIEISPDVAISGDILLPAITSDAILEHEVPVYEISGDILLPALTSEATATFGEPNYLINGDILLPALTSEAVLEHDVPIYEISGDILLPALTTEATATFGEPNYLINGDILLPAITTEAVLIFNSLKNVSISVIPIGAGTVTGAGVYEEGEAVLLTATITPGYIFGYWMLGGNILSYSSSYVYTVTAANTQSLVAFFEIIGPTEIIPSPGARVPLFTGLQLSVNGEYLDLPIGFETQLNRFNPIFQTEGVIRDDYTLPIPLPHSDHNARILGNPGIIENKNRFATRTDAVLYYNGMPQLRGQLRIKTPVNKQVITVNFVSGISEISTDLAERPLREIMDEEIVIHSTDFNREITLTYQPAISTFFAIQIIDSTFEEATLADLVIAINDEPDFPYAATSPGANEITISPLLNNEFLDFWISFIPGSEWRLNTDPPYTASYIDTYSTFINQYRGVSPSNKLRFPTNANFYGFFEESGNKVYPIANYYVAEKLGKNHVFQPAGFGTLLGTIGNPQVRNLTSLAPYVTVEYVLERIAAFYDITIKAPFVGPDAWKMIVDNPNTLDRPVRYIENQRIILYERSFNMSSLVPDMKVNEFLKALQGMGYALTYNQYSRTLEYFERDPIVVQDTYIDFSNRFGDVLDIQNQQRKGVTFRHSEDSSDKISQTGVLDAENGKKPYLVGDGEKIIETGFAVPIVRDNTLFFPTTAGTLKTVVTKDMQPADNYVLRLAFSFESFFFYPAMIILGEDFSLSWFGAEGLAQTNYKHWKEVENESATITIPIHLTEIEALRNPYWLYKILIDRNKYIIQSFELVIQDNTEYFECDAILVRIPYSERDAGE